MTFLTPATASIGLKVRLRIGRHWHPATIVSLGTDFGGTPTAAVNLYGRTRETRHEYVHKLRLDTKP